MPQKCCISGCRNSRWKRRKPNKEITYQTFPNEGKEITFHYFPKDEEVNRRWKYHINLCTKQENVGKNPVICSAHFNESDVIKRKTNVILRNLAVPCVFPNMNYTDYEVLYYPDDKENVEPNAKKIKLDVESLKLNASTPFLAPLVVVEADITDDSLIETNLSSNTTFNSTSFLAAMNDSVDTVASVDAGSVIVDTKKFPDICDVSVNFPTCEPPDSFHTSTANITHSTPKTRRIRYPGDIDEESEMSPNTARNNVRLCKTKIKSQSKEIYKLKQTVKRQRKQIDTLKQLMRKVKISFGLSNQATQSIESTFEDDILEQLKEGRKTRSYSENVKSFALTLNFYSNAAYLYVRRTFGKHLPAPSTLFRWYKCVNGDPGISVEALTILKSMSDDMMKQDKTLFLGLMTDEMAIRTQLIWNDTKKQFIGYIDHGLGTECNDNTEEASDALVFMVVPINAKGKLPLAYYLTNKFSGEEKAEIVKKLLRAIDDTGSEVISFTFDGASSNITMVECFGANLSFQNMKPFFENPYSKRKIYIFLDICHMIKLVRNNWAAKGILFNSKGDAIKWEYIEKLETLQKKEGLSLGTKLTSQHIKFQNDKMKVRFAVQVLSRRVADALTYCKDMDQFKGCEATIEFVKLFNDAFDVLNSISFSDKGYKHPLHKTSHENFKNLFEKVSEYISGLTLDVPKKMKEKIVIERKNIVVSGVKTGFIGFLVGMKNMKAIYDSYVSSGLLSYLLGYKFSQDHLETMFAVIRCKGGFNNNPNCVQFKSAFKRLLMRNQLTSSLNANCLSTTANFLYFSRLTKDIIKDSNAYKKSQFYDDAADVWEDAFDEINTFQLSEYAVDVVAYIAGFVERTLKKKLKCDNCLNTISKTDVINSKLIRIKNLGGLTTPQRDIFTICKTAEQIMWSSDLSQPQFYNRLSCRIMRQFVDKPLFSDMSHPSNALECEHSLLLIKTVVTIYLKVRLHHIAKHHNINSKSKFLRSKCTKLIHFSHQ